MVKRTLVALFVLVCCGLLAPRSALAGGFVLATERASTTVAKIDVTNDSIVGRVTVGSVPSAIAVDPVRRWAYVSVNLGDKISVVQADSLTAADVLIPGLGRQPIGVALTSDYGRLLVATRGVDGVISADDRLDIVQLSNSAWPPTGSVIASIPTGLHPVGVCIDHADRYAVVTARNQPAVLIIDLQTNTVVAQDSGLPPDAEPEGIDLHPTANVAYATLHGPISRIEVIDLDTQTFSNHVLIINTPAARPSGGHFTPDGQRFFVSGQTVNKVLMFNTANPLQPVQDMSVQLAVGPQPHAIAYFPDGRAYVANTNNGQPTGSISVIHNYLGTPTVSGPILSTLGGPLGLGNFAWLIQGDLNCDGATDSGDISAFVLALVDPAGYESQYPLCPLLNADFNGDGLIDGRDIPGFVAELLP